jgi:hypothetical protein
MSNNYRFAKRGNNGSASHTGSKEPSTSKGTASPVAGVNRLDYGHDNNFVIIRQQLADKLREDHGVFSRSAIPLPLASTFCGVLSSSTFGIMTLGHKSI